MNWTTKAKILKTISYLPFSEDIYPFFQRHFGRLNDDPYSRFPIALSFLEMLKKNSFDFENKTIFELGTGHLPLLPIFFYLTGAKEIYTYDLNRRLNLNLFSNSLKKIVNDRDYIIDEMSRYVKKDILNERMNVIEKFKDKPLMFLSKALIHYVSPGDASKTEIKSKTIDFHFSCTTFEHIPEKNLIDIMIEASRILKDKSCSIHLIDPSDHFQHQDTSISKINFLRYSENEWSSIAGNSFAFCNRLRYSDYIKIFTSNNFSIIDEKIHTDENSISLLKSNFDIDDTFKNYNFDDLAITSFMILLINNK
jgi:hypothetical protein